MEENFGGILFVSLSCVGNSFDTQWRSQKFFSRGALMNIIKLKNNNKNFSLIPKQTSNGFTCLIGLLVR